MCSLVSGSRRDDSSSSSSWWWRMKPRHGQPSPPPASLRVIRTKGVQRLPSSGLGGTHRCLGARWPCRGAQGEATAALPSAKVCALHSRLPSSGHSREAKLAWWEPLGAPYPQLYQSRMLASVGSGAPHPVIGATWQAASPGSAQSTWARGHVAGCLPRLGPEHVGSGPHGRLPPQARPRARGLRSQGGRCW